MNIFARIPIAKEMFHHRPEEKIDWDGEQLLIAKSCYNANAFRHFMANENAARYRTDKTARMRGSHGNRYPRLSAAHQIFDMKESLKFYCDDLGFEIGETDGKQLPGNDWALLKLQGVELMLNTAFEASDRPATPDLSRVAAHRDVCLYFGCPDVDAAYAHMLAKGVKAQAPKVAPYGMKQLYVTDPDGYELCFQWRAAPRS